MVCVCKAVVTSEVDSLRVACDMYILMMMMMMMLRCTAIVRKVDGFVFGIHVWARGYCGYCGP